jgi:hypothetical protein
MMSEETRQKRRAYTTGWRARNQDRAHAYQKTYNKARTASRQAVLHAAKDKPCADCGIRYPPYVMDFDHVRGEKKQCIGRMLSQSLQAILEEIEKCDVVCSNCHRERTQSRKRTVGVH